jgi:hypothetical protein
MSTDKYDKIAVMAAIKTDFPEVNSIGWDKFTVAEYDVDEEDLNTCIDIDFAEFFKGHDLERLINYTKKIAVSPSIFMDFIIFNDGRELEYDMDWQTMICHLKQPITSCRTPIGIYCDKKYINETIIFLNELDTKSTRVE